MSDILIDRFWAMASKDTFSIPPIQDFLRFYVREGTTTVDPFAGDSVLAGQWTNDINPDTRAVHHMTAAAFLSMLAEKQIVADCILFDPPYTLRQVQEVYERHGIWKFEETQNAQRWTIERDLAAPLVRPGGVVISFGYTTTCMGETRGFGIERIRIVSHGPAHNGTLCTAERKRQPRLI